jgi:hypothetical protein
MQNRDVYIEKMKLQLDELNATMTELEAQAQESKDIAFDKYKAEMASLHQQSQLAMDKLDELKASGEGSWKELVIGTEKVRDAFIHSFHDFKSRL